jgi:hypothetical protein
VIIDKKKPNGGVSAVGDDSEYDNDLIVTDQDPSIDPSENNVIMVVNRANKSATNISPTQSVPPQPFLDDHIYMNVNKVESNATANRPVQTSGSTTKEAPIIRESLGFDIDNIISQSSSHPINNVIAENIYENDALKSEDFDSELLELNQQIKSLLNAPPPTQFVEEKEKKQQAPQAPPVVSFRSSRPHNSISNDDLNNGNNK